MLPDSPPQDSKPDLKPDLKPDPKPEHTPKKKPHWLLSLLPYVLIPVIVYFANVEVQSYLGRKALAGVAMEKHSLDAAMAIAARENKKILADMSAIWCPSCRKLDKQVLANPKVQARIEQDYVFARVEYETEEGKAFMERYGVSSFPTLLILDADGTKLRQLPISFSPDSFIQSL